VLAEWFSPCNSRIAFVWILHACGRRAGCAGKNRSVFLTARRAILSNAWHRTGNLPVSELTANGFKGRALRHGVLLGTYSAAILVSAALLFVVQPMFTKMVLPRLGGAPSVWSVAIVFFQSALVAGYAFAHLLARYAPGFRSVVIHSAVMIAALFALPLSVAEGWSRPPAAGEAFWLIGLFSVSVGLPFFALAVNAPLLQAWFARSDHPAGKDPYFLYAASNIGSFLALLSYPVAIEPFIRLGDQARLWSLVFAILIVMLAACGVFLWRTSGQLESTANADIGTDIERPAWQDAAYWVVLAAVPSALLVAVTAHISTDIAAVPLLWVTPLALYLLTFVIAFARRPIVPHWFVVAAQPWFMAAGIAALAFFSGLHVLLLIPVHLAALFAAALMCHGELARKRPAARHLTAFYLWISVGGMLGGIAAALVAPHVFNWVAEYPILIALAALCRPVAAWPAGRRWRPLTYGASAAAVLLLIVRPFVPLQIDAAVFTWTVGAFLIVSTLSWRGLPAAVIVAAAVYSFVLQGQQPGISLRSFFGVAKIYKSPDGQFRVLKHGTTVHGMERIRQANGEPVTGRPEPLIYYRDGSGIAQTIEAVKARVGGPIQYAVIGLGAGALACRAEPADTVHFYEIDPLIIRIARDANLFGYLSRCRPGVPIILGDARLTLADTPDASYDLIIVDAFSSDAIPIHLLTREAMAIYVKKLRPRGMVVLHVSNRYLELASVVAGVAASSGLTARVYDESRILRQTHRRDPFSSLVVAVVRNEEDFGTLAPWNWELRTPDPKQWVWTDDYSNILGSLRRRLQEGRQ
jgi:hypothetical protein